MPGLFRYEDGGASEMRWHGLGALSEVFWDWLASQHGTDWRLVELTASNHDQLS